MTTNRNKRTDQKAKMNSKPKLKLVDHLEIEASDGFVENQAMTEVMPGYHTGTYQAITDGEQSLKASYLGDVKITSITVKPIPSKLINLEFTSDAGFVYQNESAEVLLTFDKPLTDGQKPTYRTNPNLMIATKFVLASDALSGTFTVMGVNVGTGRVFVSLGGVDKDVSITVKEAPAILSRIVTKPAKVFEGSNVEVRLIHDKTPNKELISITADPTFTLQGDIIVEGTDAVAIYKTTKYGDYAIEAKSHKITKTVNVNVGKIMPKITNVSVPTSVLADKEFTVAIDFDKSMYLNASDVQVVFDKSAKITVVEDLKVIDNRVIGKYRAPIAYVGVVKIKYLTMFYPVITPITVRAQAKVQDVTFDPNKLILDGKSNVVVDIDK